MKVRFFLSMFVLGGVLGKDTKIEDTRILGRQVPFQGIDIVAGHVIPAFTVKLAIVLHAPDKVPLYAIRIREIKHH